MIVICHRKAAQWSWPLHPPPLLGELRRNRGRLARPSPHQQPFIPRFPPKEPHYPSMELFSPLSDYAIPEEESHSLHSADYAAEFSKPFHGEETGSEWHQYDKEWVGEEGRYGDERHYNEDRPHEDEERTYREERLYGRERDHDNLRYFDDETVEMHYGEERDHGEERDRGEFRYYGEMDPAEERDDHDEDKRYDEDRHYDVERQYDGDRHYDYSNDWFGGDMLRFD